MTRGTRLRYYAMKHEKLSDMGDAWEQSVALAKMAILFLVLIPLGVMVAALVVYFRP